jgi:hypothetical protein
MDFNYEILNQNVLYLIKNNNYFHFPPLRFISNIIIFVISLIEFIDSNKNFIDYYY